MAAAAESPSFEVKPREDRVAECLDLIKQLTERLGIPGDNPSMRVLRKRMANYWHTEVGTNSPVSMDGTLPLISSNRTIHYKFPLLKHKHVELWLKVDSGSGSGSGPRVYPEDLRAIMDETEVAKQLS